MISGRGFFRAFWRRRDGNVAMMWALMGAVLVGLLGITVDFTRAQMLRAQLQNAVDGAALAAARDVMTPEQREEAARSYFDAEMGDLAPTATLLIADIPGTNQVTVSARMPMQLSIARIVRNEDWMIYVDSDAERSGNNIEVAMVLDVTGSMAGQRIIDLREAATNLVDTVIQEQQTPYYSKIALVPYSMGVNAGGYADEARGDIIGPADVDAAAWHSGSARSITGITRANPAVVTSANHGFANGDTVYIRNVSGMSQVNHRVFVVANRTTNTFQLQGVNSSTYNSYSSGGIVTECLNTTCSVEVTASGHDFSANDRVYFTGVNGMTQLNNTLFTISAVDSGGFTLSGTHGSYSTYTSGGDAHCVVAGCDYFAFQNSSANNWRVFPASNCVSERVSSQEYTDASPASAYVGLNYPSSANACPAVSVVPLTTDGDYLNGRIATFQAAGSTAGHIGLAWGWYMLSPNWASLFSASEQGASYSAPETLKIVVLMTDGAFNTGYCNGVISDDSDNGAGAASERINCDATNGQPFDQARALCTAMKNQDIIIYTVGFGLGADANATDFMEDCATSDGHAYSADDGEELIAAFNAIAASITQLRITR
ncbi:MAG TPA: ubiquitin-activating E1 FCCH domain-containing protein [Candidatus Binatia bacterium]|nr:ubiquitin-activating E1 FCCH domain-containing protein [Candidatus Binatia bacterium]